jgi:hypothetical protein
VYLFAAERSRYEKIFIYGIVLECNTAYIPWRESGPAKREARKSAKEYVVERSEHGIGRKGLGAFLIGESLLIWVPLIVLGAAIEWPASLSEPAEVILPLILERAPAVTTGYFAYLVYSILFFPMAYLTIAYLEGGRVRSHLGWIGVGFAAISTLARTIGITRWLTAMPILARQWVQAPGREIEIAYDTLNALAGGIGEVVGVGVFAGVWAFVASRAILKYRLLPAWSGWMGIAAGISVMAPIVELLGVDITGFITITTSLIHIWWLVLGVGLLIKRSEG